MSSSQSSSTSPPLLIEASALNSLLSGSCRVPRVLDASWFMPNDAKSRVGKEEHEKRRIKGSLFWNVDEVATKGDEVRNLPHMAPTGEVFAKAAGESYSLWDP